MRSSTTPDPRARFFNQINYSFANEDGASERTALQLTGGDTALCIAGSGARAFDLLVGEAPQKLWAIDFNPCQIFLLELKVAAIKALNYSEFAAFSGMTPAPSSQRQRVYAGLRRALSAPARSFWDTRADLLGRGVLLCGTWERWLSRLAQLPRTHGALLRRLVDCTTLAEQRALWERASSPRLWRWGLNLLGQRWLWQHVLREPGIAFVPRDFDIGAYLHARIGHLLSQQLLAESFFAQWMILGQVRHAQAYPAHLQPAGYAQVQHNINCLGWQHASLQGFLGERTGPPVTALSLSDFGSYTSAAEYRAIWRALLQHCAHGARVCERQFLVKLDPVVMAQEASVDLGVQICRDAALEARLAHQDTSFIYTFVCATLQRAAAAKLSA